MSIALFNKRKNAVLNNGGVAPTFEPETTAYMNALSVPNTEGAIYYPGTPQDITGAAAWSLLNDTILYFKNNGVWNLIINWLPMFGTTAAQKGYNAKNPANFYATFNGSWSFTAGGNQGNGSNTYATFGFVPNAQFSVDNFIEIITSLSNTTNNGVDLGASGTHYLTSRFNAKARFVPTTYVADFEVSIASTIGIFSGVSYNDNGTQRAAFYQNQTELYNVAAGITMPSTQLYYGAFNNGGTPAYFSDRLLGSTVQATGTPAQALIISQGITMWEQGLGRL